jgi:hypothetical protein
MWELLRNTGASNPCNGAYSPNLLEGVFSEVHEQHPAYPGPMPYAPPSRVGAIFHIIPPDVSYRIAAVLARLDHGYAMFYEVR